MSAEFLLAVDALKAAAELVVQSEGAYDLENLADCAAEVEDACE